MKQDRHNYSCFGEDASAKHVKAKLKGGEPARSSSVLSDYERECAEESCIAQKVLFFQSWRDSETKHWNNTISKVWGLLKMNYIIHKGCIKMIKSDSKDFYNVSKDFKYMLFLFIKKIHCKLFKIK